MAGSSQLKPGRLSHVLANGDSIARGERGYDFLAGGGGHKSHLANREQAMKWIAIGRDSPEAKLRVPSGCYERLLTDLPEKTAPYSVFGG